MPEKTVKRRLQDCDAALASDEGPIFSTVAKLVEAIQAAISVMLLQLRLGPRRLAFDQIRGYVRGFVS